MKLIDRIILTIYSLLIGLFALLLLFVPFSDVAYNWTNYLIKSYSMDWQNSFIPVIFLAISIRFLLSGIKTQKGRNQSVVRHTAFGEVNISLQAIEAMAQKSARIVPGLRDIKAVAQLLNDGLIVHISALALSDINIPESSIKVQQSIKEYIEECTGISVKEIKVKINNLANQSKGRVE